MDKSTKMFGCSQESMTSTESDSSARLNGSVHESDPLKGFSKKSHYFFSTSSDSNDFPHDDAEVKNSFFYFSQISYKCHSFSDAKWTT